MAWGQRRWQEGMNCRVDVFHILVLDFWVEQFEDPNEKKKKNNDRNSKNPNKTLTNPRKSKKKKKMKGKYFFFGCG